ncbi:hypothetical protein FB451DRAFT_1270401 [Mycena latifolia]|nr:hypothetical protein FB451DRAFT_1270401 [Mycena latifolia]
MLDFFQSKSAYSAWLVPFSMITYQEKQSSNREIIIYSVFPLCQDYTPVVSARQHHGEGDWDDLLGPADWVVLQPDNAPLWCDKHTFAEDSGFVRSATVHEYAQVLGGEVDGGIQLFVERLWILQGMGAPRGNMKAPDRDDRGTLPAPVDDGEAVGDGCDPNIFAIAGAIAPDGLGAPWAVLLECHDIPQSLDIATERLRHGFALGEDKCTSGSVHFRRLRLQQASNV